MRDTFQSMPHHQPCAEGFGALQLGILKSVMQKRDSSQSRVANPLKGFCQKRRGIYHLLEHSLAVVCKQFNKVFLYEYWQFSK